MLKFILCTAGAFILGALIEALTNAGIRASIEHFIRNRRVKKKPEHDEIMDSLSADTQVILKQYMEQFDLWGQTVYMVRDIRKFDILLRNHCFYEPYKSNRCDLNKCINENLRRGSGFVIFADGKEYVAISPITSVSADCLVK